MGRIEALIVRAEAHRVLNDCPARKLTKLIPRLPANLSEQIASLPKDDCQVVLLGQIRDNFGLMRNVHELRGAKGLSAGGARPVHHRRCRPPAACGDHGRGGQAREIGEEDDEHRRQHADRQDGRCRQGLAGGIWPQMEAFALPELKKIAVQIEALGDPASPWSLEEKKVLLQMQLNAAVSVIVAMTALTMQLVQDAINAIIAAVKGFVNGAIGIPLI